MSRVLRSLAAVSVALLLLASCGDDDEVSEEDAVELLTDELQTSTGLAEDDAKCVSEAIVDEIGVDGLASIGLQAGEEGDIENLSTEEQQELFTLIQQSFDECEIDPADAVN